MGRIAIILEGMAGVDMTTNPMFLPQERLSAATNIVFDEGEIRTRPGFRYHSLDVAGVFQGASVYSPSRGLSHQPFSDPYTAIVVAASGDLTYHLSKGAGFECPVLIGGDADLGCGDLNIFQAENYLVVQSPLTDTIWWEGAGDYTISPGLDATEDAVQDLLLQADLVNKSLVGANIDCCFQKIDYCQVEPRLEEDEGFSSHDTLIFSEHRNFLINSAGIGIYTNGRIHQESRSGIFVSDLIHKRGTKYTDDILLMEEQQAGSFGDPLSTNSRLGQLRAMEVLPAMSSANGEGALIAYYDSGVVSFDTFAAPRETRYDAEEGTIVQKGWSETRQVNHLLNRVSATGRYAVAVLPRDHAFRSRYGVHLLKTSLGEGSFNDEYTNTLSQDMQPILDADTKQSLRGVTVGQWTEGNRLLASVGMFDNTAYSSSPMAKGFVVWNQATTYTEDRTPRPLWEGLWSPHSEIAGIHRLLDVTEVGGGSRFGFVSSTGDGDVVFGEIDHRLRCDVLNDVAVPIEWNITSRKIFGGFSKLNRITDGRLELEATGSGGAVRVLVRTDTSADWKEWYTSTTSTNENTELHSINLGLPPKDCRTATWFQFKVEGIGHVVIRMLEAEVTEDRGKLGKPITIHTVSTKPENYHAINQLPSKSRWT